MGWKDFVFLALNGWGKNWKDDNGKQPKLLKKNTLSTREVL